MPGAQEQTCCDEEQQVQNGCPGAEGACELHPGVAKGLLPV